MRSLAVEPHDPEMRSPFYYFESECGIHVLEEI